MPSEKGANDGPKWWIDEKRATGEPRKDEIPPAIARFYVTTRGYEQERARSGLVDLNLKLLAEGNPPEGEFAYLNWTPEKAPADVLQRIRAALALPSGARAVVVDAGRMVRVVVTGSPPGERVLEFNFNRGEPSFDAWIGNDWKEEQVFRSVQELMRRAPRLLARYLGANAFRSELF